MQAYEQQYPADRAAQVLLLVPSPGKLGFVSRSFVPPRPGERFGRWTVTGPTGHSSPGHRTVQCQCDCGTERFVLVDQLRKGRSKSCGCLRAELTKSLITRTRWKGSHGMRYHPLYGIHQGIMARCYRPQDVHYPRWGGRGIRVHEPWHDIRVFVAWIDENLGPRPPRASLDRWPDNDGDYAPGNVRWATARQQQETTRLRRGTDGRFHSLPHTVPHQGEFIGSLAQQELHRLNEARRAQEW